MNQAKAGTQLRCQNFQKHTQGPDIGWLVQLRWLEQASAGFLPWLGSWRPPITNLESRLITSWISPQMGPNLPSVKIFNSKSPSWTLLLMLLWISLQTPPSPSTE